MISNDGVGMNPDDSERFQRKASHDFRPRNRRAGAGIYRYADANVPEATVWRFEGQTGA
jgi:hypothetical protein